MEATQTVDDDLELSADDAGVRVAHQARRRLDGRAALPDARLDLLPAGRVDGRVGVAALLWPSLDCVKLGKKPVHGTERLLLLYVYCEEPRPRCKGRVHKADTVDLYYNNLSLITSLSDFSFPTKPVRFTMVIRYQRR